MSSTEVHVCPHCNSQSNIYWHKVTPGIVRALIKVRRAVIAKGDYSIHNRKDMDGTPYELTKNEYGNFTMLRYHGLVARDKDAGAGNWILTHRGAQFLRSEIRVPMKVKVLNNTVIDHDDVYVSIEDVLGSGDPAFIEIEQLEREHVPLDVAQVSLPI